MLTNVLGIILTENSDIDLEALTKRQPFSTVQFGGRFKVIDFLLSNLTNASVDDIAYFADEPNRALMSHLQDRRVWNLNSKNGGLDVLFQNTQEVGYTNSEIAYMHYALSELNVVKDKEFIIVCNNMNYLYNYNYQELIKQAIDMDVDVVGLYKKVRTCQLKATPTPIFHVEKGYVRYSAINTDMLDEVNVDLGVYVMRVGMFKRIIQEAASYKTTQTFQSALYQKIEEVIMYANEFTGYVGMIDDVASYYRVSMELLNREVSQELFYGTNKILTKSRDEASTYFSPEADIKNSMLSSGCSVEGRVRNSIVSRRVKIEKDTVIENCIILSNAHIRRGVRLKNMIVGKGAMISNNTELSGTIKAPYVLPDKVNI